MRVATEPPVASFASLTGLADGSDPHTRSSSRTGRRGRAPEKRQARPHPVHRHAHRARRWRRGRVLHARGRPPGHEGRSRQEGGSCEEPATLRRARPAVRRQLRSRAARALPAGDRAGHVARPGDRGCSSRPTTRSCATTCCCSSATRTTPAISTREGKEKLRPLALEAVRKVVAGDGGKPQLVEAVYFTSFVMQ